MNSIPWFVATLLIAFIAGLLGKRLRLPAGLLVGSMVAVAAFNILTGKGVFYPGARVMLQVFSGALVGSRIGVNELKSMKSLLLSVVVLIASMLVLNITVAFAVLMVSDLSPATALFATSPGGANDMSIIAPDFGGDAGVVAILQVCRLILIYLFIPPTIRYLDKREQVRHPERRQTPPSAEPMQGSAVSTDKKQFLLMLLAAAVGGTILYLLGVSAGAMIGGMIGSAAFCVTRGRQKYPAKLKTLLQLCSGAYIGCKIDRATVMNLDQLLLPLLIMLAGIFAFTFLTSALIRRLSHLDRSTAMLASTPGGIQEMSLLSEELGADTPKVAVMHTARIAFVILFFPYIIQLLLHLIPQ